MEVEVEDHVMFLTKMKNGSTGLIEASKIAAGSEDDILFEIYGTNGAIKYNSMDPNFLKVFNRKEKDRGWKILPTVQRYLQSSNFPGPKFSIGWIRAHIHSIYSFLSSVHTNETASPSLYDGIYNMKVIEAVQNSSKTRKWHKLG